MNHKIQKKSQLDRIYKVFRKITRSSLFEAKSEKKIKFSLVLSTNIKSNKQAQAGAPQQSQKVSNLPDSVSATSCSITYELLTLVCTYTFHETKTWNLQILSAKTWRKCKNTLKIWGGTILPISVFVLFSILRKNGVARFTSAPRTCHFIQYRRFLLRSI